MTEIVAFVPAKSSSTRVQSKNMQEIKGLPLFLWAASNLARVIPKEQIYIDSDGEQILESAVRCGFRTIERPKELATNATDGNSLLAWQVSNVQADIYVQHLPPMPFLRKETLVRGIDAVVKKQNDSAVAVYEEAFYLWNNKGEPLYDLKNIPNSFDLEKYIVESMGLYIINSDAFEITGTRIGNNPLLLNIEGEERIDIDTPADLRYAKVVADGLPRPQIAHVNETRLKYQNIQSQIKLVVMDVDGTLTDGGMYYTNSGDNIKKFNTRDGRGILLLHSAGIQTCMLTSGAHANLMKNRCAELGIQHFIHSKEDKQASLVALVKSLSLELSNVAVIGDDINDIKLMEIAGVSFCPRDADDEVKRKATFVLNKTGGHGCVREFADMVIGRGE